MSNMIIRYSPPSQYDQFPLRTLCKVNLNEESFEIYIQMNHDENLPNWQSLGVFNTKDDQDSINNKINKIINI
jgi:hypothetical protein